MAFIGLVCAGFFLLEHLRPVEKTNSLATIAELPVKHKQVT